MNKFTKEYVKLVRKIFKSGIRQKCRNGEQLIIPHYSFTVDFSKGKDSAKLKLRKMYYKGVEGEFKTLIDPTSLTNVTQFEANGCYYWKPWADENGSINIDYHNQMHPQLEILISEIRQNPTSRRHIIDLWVPKNIWNNSLSLPCCWHNLTFSVIENILHLKWVQRSVDTMIGLPSDVYLAYLFMEFIANQCKLGIGSCMFSLSNVHIYDEHIRGANDLLSRYKRGGNHWINKALKFKIKE